MGKAALQGQSSPSQKKPNAIATLSLNKLSPYKMLRAKLAIGAGDFDLTVEGKPHKTTS